MCQIVRLPLSLPLNALKRHSSSVKQHNLDSKLLYGEVIKKKKNKAETKSVPLVEKPVFVNESSFASRDISSEIYWQLRERKVKNLFPLGKKKSTTENRGPQERPEQKKCRSSISESNTAENTSISTLNGSSSKISAAKSFIPKNKKSSTGISQSIQIPFSASELKSILTYPLVCEKATNEIMKNIDSYALPSVGKVIQSTMSEGQRRALENWKNSKIAELGQEGFLQLQKTTFETGSLFHKSIENFLLHKTEPENIPTIQNLWGSVKQSLGEVETQPLLVETPLIHPFLKYKGIVDCVSIIR